MEDKHKRYLKLNLISLFFVTVSFISVSLAWFAYTGIASSGLDVDIKAWHIEFNGKSKAQNEIVIPLTNIYPGMDTIVESVNIKNKGDSDAKLSYKIKSIRILDEEIDTTVSQDELLDQLANNYPFSIDISISKQYIDASIGESSIDLSVSWPLDSDNDKDDSLWGDKTYQFQDNEKKLAGSDPEYSERTSIKVVIDLLAEQNVDKFTYNTGNMILYNPIEDKVCDTIGGNCYKTNMISTYQNESEEVYLIPNILNDYGHGIYEQAQTIYEELTEDWITKTKSFEIQDLINIVGLDVNKTILKKEKKLESGEIIKLSDEIVGYVTNDKRFEEFMTNKMIKYNGQIEYDSEKYDYLSTEKCYWLNYEISEDKAYAMKKDREGVMKIYPELKTEDCYVAPIIIMPKSKVYTE